MHADSRPRSSAKTAAVAATAALAVLLALLAMQHYRHDWPFSLHHGRTSSEQATPLATTSPAPRDEAHDRHPRAAVDLDPIRLAAAELQVEPVRRETIARTIRAVATVVPDERRISHVHTRVSGWIEELLVNATGEHVRAGQPLAAIFSQDLYASQIEYLTALVRSSTGPQSAVSAGARARLNVLGMTDAEIAAIERSREPRQLVTVTAPRSGVVLRRGVSVGTAVDPSTELFTLADLSAVWVVAELPEQEVSEIVVATAVTLDFGDSGVGVLDANVDFIYPTLSERTRTTRVRMAVSNPDGALRPGMYGNASFRTQPREALTVPRDAIVDTDTLQHVFIAVGDRRFEPRPVKLGVRLPERVEILDGIAEGERVVTSGVFLLDSESRLRSVGGAGPGHAGHGAGRASPDTEPAGPSDHSSH